MAIELKLTTEELKKAIKILREEGGLGPLTTGCILDDYLALRALVTKLDEGLVEIENMREVDLLIDLLDVQTPFIRDLRSLVPDSLKFQKTS